MSSIFFRFLERLKKDGLNALFTQTYVARCTLDVKRLFISSVVNQIISGCFDCIDPKKFPTLSFELQVLSFEPLRLCCIIHPVIQTFCVFFSSLSLPVILSSDFCLTEHVSNITISASLIFSVYENPQLSKTALILALSA